MPTATADYTTDSTFIALLKGALTEPADDHARLVLADRLEELGQEERAAQIRCSVSGYRNRTVWPETFGPSGEALTEPLPLPSGVMGTFERGFWAHIELSPADWFAHHESLYWQPEQTVECPECRGKGRIEFESGIKGGPNYGPHKVYVTDPRRTLSLGCKVCGGDGYVQSGSGRVPRPVSPTAQPLETVRLTTAPEYESNWRKGLLRLVGLPTWHKWDGILVPETIPSLLAREWPRIRFLLPGDAE